MFAVLNPVTRCAVLTLGLCALLTASACGSSTPAQPTPPGSPPVVDPPAPPAPPPRIGVHRILAFGDSMTAGTTSPPLSVWALTPGLSQSYPFKLFDMRGRRGATLPVGVLLVAVVGASAWAVVRHRSLIDADPWSALEPSAPGSAVRAPSDSNRWCAVL